MIRITHQVQNYKAQREGTRFVRRAGDEYAWCIRDALDLRYDIKQGRCDATDLPADIRKAADEREGFWPPYVEWPQ